jgi:Transposase DDE domain
VIDHVTILYVIIDDWLKALGHREDPRRQFSDAEVMTAALTAALYFGGQLERSRDFLRATRLMPLMLSRSRLNRRLHALSDLMLQMFNQLGLALKANNPGGQYLLDSFPVAICDNIRIRQARLLRQEEFRGKIASKRRYFYGLRLHVLTTAAGLPVEFAWLPGAANDTRGLRVLPLALPVGSEVFLDAGYTDYLSEDDAGAADGVRLSTMRKRGSRRRDTFAEHWYKKLTRQPVETVFSQLTSLFPKHIHAVTLAGFLLKLALFIFAFTLAKAFI